MNQLKRLVVMTGLWSLALLPVAAQRWLGAMLGRLSYRRNGRSCLVSRANLRLCLPDRSEADIETLCAQSLIATGQTLVETPGIWLREPAKNAPRLGEVRGIEVLEAPLAEGRGVLILLPHIGNWEMLNVYFAGRGGGATAMYQPPRQTYLAEDMKKVRERLGNDMVPATVQGVKQLYQKLKNGATVVVLPDQVPNQGQFAPFFGEMALTDALVWRMAQRTGAAMILMCTLRRPDGKFDVEARACEPGVYDPDPPTGLAAVNLTVQRLVEDYPEQYQWEYKRFRERPAGERKLYTFLSLIHISEPTRPY